MTNWIRTHPRTRAVTTPGYFKKVNFEAPSSYCFIFRRSYALLLWLQKLQPCHVQHSLQCSVRGMKAREYDNSCYTYLNISVLQRLRRSAAVCFCLCLLRNSVSIIICALPVQLESRSEALGFLTLVVILIFNLSLYLFFINLIMSCVSGLSLQPCYQKARQWLLQNIPSVLVFGVCIGVVQVLLMSTRVYSGSLYVL